MISSLRPFFLSFLSALFLLSGCQAAPPANIAPTTTPFTIAGITYNSASPLEAMVTPLFDMKNPPAQKNYSVRYKGANGETVPAILALPAQTDKPLPCVILLHGLGGNKEQMYPLATVFANKGYAALCIDAAGHGGRKLSVNTALGEWGLPELRIVCAQTTVDLRHAVDFLQSRSDIDRSRIGYVGVSLGGIIGSLFVANEPRIKTAVLWAAGGDWPKLVAQSQVSLAIHLRKVQRMDVVQIARDMKEVEPLNAIAKAERCPILFLNGDHDTIVPTVCAQELFAKAKGNKKQVLLPGGHIPDLPTMIRQTVEWMARYDTP